MHHGVDAVDCGPNVLGPGDIADDELRAPGMQLLRLARGGIAHQRAYRPVCGAQRVHDARSDEAGSTGDEDHVKFL